MMSNPQLALILGDQLSHKLSIFDHISKENDEILMMEVTDEAEYVKHHKKKLVFIFSAMRQFAEELKEKGYKVNYIKLFTDESKSSFTETLEKFLNTSNKNFSKILTVEASEYRVLKTQESWLEKYQVKILEDKRFITTKAEFREWATDKKSLLMENFYREVRKKTDILIDIKGKPIGGKWNYDHDNRETLNTKTNIEIPERFNFPISEITKEVIEMVKTHFPDNFGDIEPFNWAIDAKSARKAFNHFIEHFLPNFGKYQDAMLEGEAFIYHSVISHYLNIGLLEARELCLKAESEYMAGKVAINAAEGFIRQIIGWREYVRGIYWLFMPEYLESNSLEAHNALPAFYWDPEATDMNCIKQVIKQTKENAYSHHIQRLMITGNLALLLGIEPKQVHDWYLAVYADAYEWVELPNTLGMALYADGGKLATKPYAASGAYVNKMSNYCKNCSYKVTEKTGETACPLNYLYWDFINRNKNQLSDNMRLRFAYKNLENFSEEKIDDIKDSSQKFFEKIYINSKNIAKK